MRMYDEDLALEFENVRIPNNVWSRFALSFRLFLLAPRALFSFFIVFLPFAFISCICVVMYVVWVAEYQVTTSLRIQFLTHCLSARLLRVVCLVSQLLSSALFSLIIYISFHCLLLLWYFIAAVGPFCCLQLLL
jgi:hypothetical protein